MLGIIHIAIKTMVVEKFGEEAWPQILARADTFIDDDWEAETKYSDSTTVAIVVAAAEVLGTDVAPVLETFGRYFLSFLKETKYDKLLYVLGGTLKDFLYNLDYLHTHLQLVFPDASFPHFMCRDTSRRPSQDGEAPASQKTGDLFLSYQSVRGALLVPFVRGLVSVIAEEVFNTPVSIIDMEPDALGMVEMRITFQETLVPTRTSSSGSFASGSFATVASANTRASLLGRARQPPRSISQRNLAESASSVPGGNGSMRGSSDTHDTASDTWDCITGDQKAWDSIDMDVLKQQFGLHTEFFLKQWPWHMILDKNLNFVMVGERVRAMFPRIYQGSSFRHHFAVERPSLPERVSLELIQEYANVCFLVHSRTGKHIRLRGSMEIMNTHNDTIVLFLCSPRILSIENMIDAETHLTDIPLHDAARDLVLVSEHMSGKAKMMLQLEKMQAQLIQEQKATDQLLSSILPEFVVQDIRAGRRVKGRNHDMISILFSDIVGFTNISAQCEPQKVCSMLDELYTVFDTIASFTSIYKVETIGDAYMAAGGLFEDTDGETKDAQAEKRHAVSIAEQGFAMIAGAALVKNPADGQSISIRVGMHSGPALSGVVGLMMPRYCLFGDTVNMASRMESNGEALRIHASKTTAEFLKQAGFGIEERGEIEIKGKGKHTTYWIVSQPQSSQENMEKALEAAKEALKQLQEDTDEVLEEEAMESFGIKFGKMGDTIDTQTEHRKTKRSTAFHHLRRTTRSVVGGGKTLGSPASFDQVGSYSSSFASTATESCSPYRRRGSQISVGESQRRRGSVGGHFDELRRLGSWDEDNNKEEQQEGLDKDWEDLPKVDPTDSARIEAFVKEFKEQGGKGCPFGFGRLSAAADTLLATRQPTGPTGETGSLVQFARDSAAKAIQFVVALVEGVFAILIYIIVTASGHTVSGTESDISPSGEAGSASSRGGFHFLSLSLASWLGWSATGNDGAAEAVRMMKDRLTDLEATNRILRLENEALKNGWGRGFPSADGNPL